MRLTPKEAREKGYRENCNGEWLAPSINIHKEHFVDVMSEREAVLLEALEAMVTKHISDHGLLLIGSDHPVARAQAAIAKARG